MVSPVHFLILSIQAECGSSLPASTWHCSLHYLFFSANSLVSSWCDHGMLGSLLWQSIIRFAILHEKSLHNLPLSSSLCSADFISVYHSRTSWIFRVLFCHILENMTKLDAIFVLSVSCTICPSQCSLRKLRMTFIVLILFFLSYFCHR